MLLNDTGFLSCPKSVKCSVREGKNNNGAKGMSQQHNQDSRPQISTALQDVAAAFVTARRSARGFDEYPGAIPDSLSTAYLIQDAAIDMWPDDILGWKVGRIPPVVEDQFGCDRLAGPIFASTVITEAGDIPVEMPVYVDGFAAVEAEFVAVIGEDSPPDKLTWSRDEAVAMIADLRIGLEVASSPLATINELGPTVTVSDFGNNAGLIVGGRISNWQIRDPQSLTSETFIDGKSVGSGGAFGLTGGVVRSVQFMLELAAQRRRPLRAGDLIATGQTTGIHEVSPGQEVRIVFAGHGELACRFVAAEAQPDA